MDSSCAALTSFNSVRCAVAASATAALCADSITSNSAAAAAALASAFAATSAIAALYSSCFDTKAASWFALSSAMMSLCSFIFT